MNELEFVTPQNLDLSNCEREAIHRPNSIQSHGVFFALKEPELIILQVSLNVFDFFGLVPEEIINQNLNLLIDDSQLDGLKRILLNCENLTTINPLKFSIKNTQQNKMTIFDGIIHRFDQVLILELESTPSHGSSFLNFYYLVRESAYKIQGATNFQELTQFIVREIKKITGFDRVMVYKFDAAANGCIIAEDKLDPLESFLGLHYPASDIPAQARTLYCSNWLRLIPDINYQPVPLFPAYNPMTNKAINMTFCVLRSVSPIHIEYLRNMGVSATLCISLVKNEKLWGLIACHHYSPKFITYETRKACEFLGQVMSVELAYKEQIEEDRYYIEKLKSLKLNIINSMAQSNNFLKGIIYDKLTLLSLANAQGAVVCLGELCTLVGETPQSEDLQKLMEWLSHTVEQEVFYTDSLPSIYPAAEAFKEVASGLLLITISLTHKSYQVAWFRPEAIRTVTWGGNPYKPFEIDNKDGLRLSPRKSFEKWKETVRLKSHPWKQHEIDAVLELRSAIMLAALESSQEELRQSQELAQVTLHSIGDAVITTDAQGCIESLNPVAQKLTGWSLHEARGLPLNQVFRIIHENTREPLENPVEKSLKFGSIISLDNGAVLIAKNNNEYAIDDSAAPIRNREDQIIGAVLVFRDVTQERQLSKQLHWQANHDALTGLLNRRAFEERLEWVILQAQTLGQHYAVFYLDLDQFKIVNDTCGHLAGDELLKQAAYLLQSHIHPPDILARLGGDEFGILLNHCSLKKALEVAESLREHLLKFRFVWQEKVFSIGVSIGLVLIDVNTQNITRVLSAADAACYAAKNQGRNRVHVYQINDQELAKQRNEIKWAVRIPRALEENRFCLYYQPIFPIHQTDSLENHGEILLRLQDESGKIVSPMTFIPAAERYNLMSQIDRWVICTFFAYLEQHHSRLNTKNQGRLYTINLSGASLNDEEFIGFLHEQFTHYQVPPQIICFEVTETLAIANLKKAAQLIRTLKEIGCHFALDDFGSGMSSFAYLKSLPIDYLKIDGAFIKDIVDNPIANEIVEAVNRIGHVMGIKTIAEFVENDIILSKLRQIGVDYAQGYQISRPYPLEDMESRIF